METLAQAIKEMDRLRFEMVLLLILPTGYLGYHAGSTGTATVDGTGSTWTNSGYLYIGNSGNGTLNITNGGKVSNSYGYLGYNSGSTGTATVDGTGSTWTNSGISILATQAMAH